MTQRLVRNLNDIPCPECGRRMRFDPSMANVEVLGTGKAVAIRDSAWTCESCGKRAWGTVIADFDFCTVLDYKGDAAMSFQNEDSWISRLLPNGPAPQEVPSTRKVPAKTRTNPARKPATKRRTTKGARR